MSLERGRVHLIIAEVRIGNPSDEIISQVYSPPDCIRGTIDLAIYDRATYQTRRLRAGRTASYGSIRLFHKNVGFRQERISRPNSFSAGDHSRIKASAWKHGSTQRSPPDRTTSVSRRRCGSCRGCWTLAKAGLNSDQDNRVSACVGTRQDECSPMPMLSDLAIHNRVSGVNRVRLELQQVYESCRSLGQRLQWWVTSVWARNRA
jgi:hypothetical protein